MVEVEELGGVDVETEIFTFLGWSSGAELVEDVVVSFDLGLVDESGSFEEVGSDSSTDDLLVFVEEDLRRTARTIGRDKGSASEVDELEGRGREREEREGRTSSPPCTSRTSNCCRSSSSWHFRRLP